MFAKKPDPKQELRTSKRELSRTQTDLLRERAELERQEQKLILDIKKAAKNGQDKSAKILAKELVRLRSQKDKLTSMHAQVGSVSVRATTASAGLATVNALGKSSQVMATMNKQFDVPKMQQSMQAFEQESMKMDMAGEMMDDTIDSIMDGSDDEQETSDILDQILDEISLDDRARSGAVPRGVAGRATPAAAAASTDEDDALMARLARLQE